MSALRCAQKVWKVYYLPDETFGEVQCRLSNLVRKWLVRATKGVLGFSWWLGGRRVGLDTVWELIWLNLLLAPRRLLRGTQAFLSSFPDEGLEGRRRKVKSCHHTSKVASDSSLQWGSSGFHSVGAPRNSPPFHCFHLKLKRKIFK